VEGGSVRVLQAQDVAALRDEAILAAQEGVEAVLVGDSPLGDPFVLLGGLCDAVPGVLLGARVQLGEDERHPALLAREATTLDLVCGGRTLLCFGPPFDARLEEAIALCRAMWREGDATSEGPVYPVPGAVNRPQPAGEGSPLIALDLTGSGARDEAGGTAALADMIVVRDEAGDGRGGDEGRGAVFRLERV
jgi:alkanesulfonate monooxygenase SsuD/methylene tetrahydromethanopterin reductase-like flavin-dependent oxidoreductase (luciferase family)